MELIKGDTLSLPKGYKKTDVGVIPKDWECVKLEELLDVLTDYESNGSFASLAENVKPVDYESFAWYVRATDIENNTHISNVRYVDEASYRFLKKTSLFGGELLFLKKGDVGRVYLFKSKTKYATLSDNLYILKLNNNANSVFLYNYFKTEIGQSQIKSKVAASSIPALYKDPVKALLVPLPNLTEQKVIAQVLSDTDALIQALENKIAKKKLIKKGVMQKLLTPKEEWDYVRLGDVATMNSGGTPLTTNPKYYSGDIIWVSISDISNAGKYIQNSIKKISEEGLLNSSARLFKSGTVLLAMYASIGKCCIAVKDVSTSQAILGITTSQKLLNEFLYYYLIFKVNELVGKGQQGTQSNLSKGIVEDYRIHLPKVEEQTLIAQTLSDIDKEIVQLEQKLIKFKMAKQGMMQQLLTGKIRLV